MVVKSVVTGFELTKDKEYEVIFEYDAVYELRCDDGKVYCRNKDFFEIMKGSNDCV
jgi:hypothetical protein